MIGAPVQDPRPLVAHVLYRFDIGGLENGVVNLLNRLPEDAFRHVVIALTDVTDFRERIQRADVACIGLHKPPGHGAKLYPKLWRLLRELRPDIVHTRNLAALEMQPVAWAARTPVRIHGEHGRDLDDLDGSSRRHQRIRRAYAPFVQCHIALSKDLRDYLVGRVGIAPKRVLQIYNGVDAARFRPRDASGPADGAPLPFGAGEGTFVVGTVGRMQGVKHQTLLARAFVRALEHAPALRRRLRLVCIGDGPLRAECAAVLAAGGAAGLAWMPGERSDIPALMRCFDVFVLPSRAEGVSNTILEAMASGLPVVATAVGGNPELIEADRTGWLVPNDDVDALAGALCRLAADPGAARTMGLRARIEVERRFSLDAMVGAYHRVYTDALAKVRGRR